MALIWILSVIVLFFTIYFAVSLAIKPLINEKVDIVEEKDLQIYDRLIRLRDMGIISVEEFDKVIQLDAKGKKDEQILEYEELLEELNKLRKLEILSDMEYEIKIDRLKECLKLEKKV